MIKAVIFDMDGLMVDTEPIQSEAFANTIRAYGKEPIPFKNGLVHVVGVRGDKNFAQMKKKYGIKESIAALRKMRRVEYERLIIKKLRPMPGLFEVLDILKKNKIKMAIASGSPQKHIKYILSSLKIEKYFGVIISGEDVRRGKPDPECFELASKKLGVEPKSCLVIEDAESGIKGAKDIGMKAIGVPSIYTHGHRMKKADMICGSLKEITWDMIEKLSY